MRVKFVSYMAFPCAAKYPIDQYQAEVTEAVNTAIIEGTKNLIKYDFQVDDISHTTCNVDDILYTTVMIVSSCEINSYEDIPSITNRLHSCFN